MIDLHTHTNESDGSTAPEELVREAAAIGLEALGICDHDTFAGYDQALPAAQAHGIELVCGIELSTRLRTAEAARGRSVHLLAYFLESPPAPQFRGWLDEMRASRRDRNRRMAARLESLGLDVRLEEVEAMGRSLAGRPHFARLLVSKGYVCSIQEAFDLYLAESAKAYVERREPVLAEAIRRIRAAGGLPSIAHPLRLARSNPGSLDGLLSGLRDVGLAGLEAYHSDHTAADTEQLLSLAQNCDLAVTGGSDFHGENKPGIALGTGVNGNVCVPRRVLDELHGRAAALRSPSAGGL